ncbi:amino acid adenylation domain-containing protein [Streptomyces sp. NPDC003483]
MPAAHEQTVRSYPASAGQARLFFLWKMAPHSSAYTISWILRCQGLIDRGALAGALAAVVDRHEQLRTVFRLAEGNVEQVVLAAADDFAIQSTETEEDLRDRLATQAFDLTTGPLLRVAVYQSGSETLVGFAVHHIAFDGASQNVLHRDLATLYAEFTGGTTTQALPELPATYQDFVEWQRLMAEGGHFDHQLDYWGEQLSGLPPLLELPTGPRPAVQRHRGANVRNVLSSGLTSKVRRLAANGRVSLFTVLAAASATVLSTYAGTNLVPMGTPMDNRGTDGLGGVVGYFVNTTVLCLRLEPTARFTDLLRSAQATVIAAIDASDVPLDRVLERVAPARDTGWNPLFQVMLTLEDTPAPVDLNGLPAAEVESVCTAGSQVDLSVVFRFAGDRLEIELQYDSDLFDSRVVEAMARQLESCLTIAADDPTATVEQCQEITATDRQTVLEIWNDTTVAVPMRTVPELVDEQATRHPDAAAILFDGATTTYRELRTRSDEIAHWIRAVGIPRGARVGVCLPRSADMIALLLGIMKAGAAYVPLDPSYPEERLAHMAADAAVSLVIVDASVTVSFSTDTAIADIAKIGLVEAEGRCLSENDCTDVAYVIYTSGSTGLPKGAAMRHTGVASLAAWMKSFHSPDDMRFVLAATSISFDFSVLEVFGTLINGSTVVLARTILDLPDLPEAGLVTMVTAVPSAARALLQRGFPPAVRCIGLGGETLTGDLVDEIYEKTSAERVFNVYGPSEDTVCSTSTTIGRGDPRPSIGRPITNGRVYILNEALRPVPIGASGELYCGGSGVSAGYLNRPDLNDERFIPDPFGPVGAVLYRSGDLARFRPDGMLEYLGRADGQVKLRGFRIELGEIESVLGEHPQVAHAAVVLDRRQVGAERLIAFVVTEGMVGDAELGQTLAARVPAHMVVQTFIRLESMLLTPSGKIDRARLPLPDLIGDQSEMHEPPSGEVETALAFIWADILGTERVGRQDDFFALGGDSLQAMRIAWRIQEQFHIDFGVADLFAARSLSSLAHRVERAVATTAPTDAANDAVHDTSFIPTSFAQEAMLRFLEHCGGAVDYDMIRAFRFTETVDEDCLEHALGLVTQRHEALRTVFPGGQGTARLLDERPRIVVDTIEERATAIGVDEAVREYLEHAWSGFDLSRDIFLRAWLLSTGRETVVVLATHHVTFDGWSWRLLCQELSLAYQALATGTKPALPDLARSYADHARWQRGSFTQRQLPRELDYWRHLLTGAPELNLTDLPRPLRDGYASSVAVVDLPEGTVARVGELARSKGLTPFAVLLAAYAGALAIRSGQRDIVIGTPVSGRTHPQVEHVIGYFPNTMLIRADLRQDTSLQSAARRLTRQIAESSQYQTVHWENILEDLGVDLHRVNLALHAHEPIALWPWKTEEIPLGGHAWTKRDIDAVVREQADGSCSITAVYAESLYDESQVQAILHDFRDLLAQTLADQHSPIS